jgi:hypothetical protein
MPAGYPDFSWFVRTVRMLMVVAIAVLSGAVIGGYTVYTINNALISAPRATLHADAEAGKQTAGGNRTPSEAATPASAPAARIDPADPGSGSPATSFRPPAQQPQQSPPQQTAQGALQGSGQDAVSQAMPAQPATPQAPPQDTDTSRQAAPPSQAASAAARTPAVEPLKPAEPGQPAAASSAHEAERGLESSHAGVSPGEGVGHAASRDGGQPADQPAAVEGSATAAAPAATQSNKPVKKRAAVKRRPPASRQQAPTQDANAARSAMRDRPVYDYYGGDRYSDYDNRVDGDASWRYGDASGRSDDHVRRIILPPQPRAPLLGGFFSRGDY